MSEKKPDEKKESELSEKDLESVAGGINLETGTGEILFKANVDVNVDVVRKK